MSDARARFRPIKEVADTNPEVLPGSTLRSFRFRYIDLSAADAGTIRWSAVHETTFAAAPVRARRLTKTGDALFGTVRPNLRSHGFVPADQPGPLVASTGFTVVRAKPGLSHPGFVFHSLMSSGVTAQAVRAAIGSSYPAVTEGDVCRFQIFAPELPEQESIAHVLDTLDIAIQQTEAIVAKLKAVKQGLLHDLLTRGIDANGELRPPQVEAPHLYQASPLGWIPVTWSTETVKGLTIDSVIGPFGSDLVATDYRDSGVPVVFVRDVKPNIFEWKSNIFLSPSKANALSAHEVRPGDVVATKMGLPPCVAAVFPESMPNGIVTADIVRLRVALGKVRPHWIAEYMNSPAVMRQVERITAGVTRPKVTLRDVRALLIATPEPEEQDRILARLGSASTQIVLEEDALEKLQAQKSGLMDDLLTGRVRVTPLLKQATHPVLEAVA